jgi:hypothetical protein
MLPNERQLITDLFDRLRGFGAPQKDQEAEQLIIQLARQNPDAGYMLVQSVLVQEQALQQMTERVQQLEQQVRQLEDNSRAPAQSSGGGSFLGGLFGGGGSRPQPSVPTSRSMMGGQPAASPGGPWGRSAGGSGYQQPMQQQPMQQQPAAGGGFMKGAMATAAGVAGGMLAANAISNMMNGGNAAQASPSGNSGFNQEAANQAQDDAQDQEMQYQGDDNNDPGNFDAGDTSWDGGGDVEL